MPQEHQKVINILMEESKNIDQRCNGYHDELLNVIIDILEYERGHRISGIQIQKKIDDKCNAFGGYLHQNRQQSSSNEAGGKP